MASWPSDVRLRSSVINPVNETNTSVVGTSSQKAGMKMTATAAHRPPGR